MLTDIPQTRRAQQGIHQCMEQYIAVGVRHHASIVGDAHAPEHQRVAGPKSMYVDPESHSHSPDPVAASSHLPARAARIAIARARSWRLVILMLLSWAAISKGLPPCHSMACASSVGSRPALTAACTAAHRGP